MIQLPTQQTQATLHRRPIFSNIEPLPKIQKKLKTHLPQYRTLNSAQPSEAHIQHHTSDKNMNYYNDDDRGSSICCYTLVMISASSAVVRPCVQVPRALTSLFPDAVDCPTKYFVWVSSASSAAVSPRTRVPRALTPPCPDATHPSAT